MDSPARIQLQRAKGWQMPDNTRVVTRSTIFGNPWAVDTHAAFWWPGDQIGIRWLSSNRVPRLLISQSEAVALFVDWLARDHVPRGAMPTSLSKRGIVACTHDLSHRRAMIIAALPDLRGKNIACWCKPGSPCHGDILMEMANR